ncbi:MAG: XTP/dITP diphosphohydrolase [Sphingomonadales bacterium]|jgi:XTP/dITP diphosphohydrolase|nr:XTP/dITP diphosphohydrolase [Sphingomonadales bacterium]MEA3048353.1 XTP/dITP diphosphohydrolase [Sphingomonadales bacterium]
MRKLTGKLVIASHNQGKVREIAELLAPHGVEGVSAAELDLPEPDEIGVSFIENADLKARQAADLSGFPALADDSGLCVEALGDRPGLFSARWAEGEDGSRDFMRAMRRVEDELASLGPEVSRDAHFVCALALVWPDGRAEWFEGRADGCLVWPPRGDRGFGYDPMFLPLGREETFGEMDQAEKHRISHRAAAFAKLAEALL